VPETRIFSLRRAERIDSWARLVDVDAFDLIAMSGRDEVCRLHRARMWASCGTPGLASDMIVAASEIIGTAHDVSLQVSSTPA
jgi:hypothetical protein